MSDLQIGLIVLGVLLILLVLGFNWWQDRRVRRRMQEHFPASEQDPLLGGEEPARSVAPASEPARQRREPGIGQAAPVDAAPAGAIAAAAPVTAEGDDGEEPDPAVEVVIEIHFAEPARGTDLLPYMQSLRQVGKKQLRVFASTDRGRHRSRIAPEESYSTLQLAVLLANRSGPLTAIEWSHAWARAQDLADRFEGSIEGPDQQAVLEQAARLDDVCAALDTQVGLTLMLGAAQPAAEVLAVARGLGFAPDGARLAWLNDAGAVRFTLARGDGAAFDAGMGGIERLYLLLDVPCSPSDPHAFGRMVEVGRDLAGRLRAELVDDQGRVLADGADAVIDERLRALFEQLEQAGLPAGSERAQRVFA
ncbi:cell division protein ZipA C-terminal FtsZ-binding domain-containing protein [Bordetella holmesii]|uniref:Cell division protein ZipA n=3 Tax=Bordetella holmesii TaxID=35814 RepID=A0A158M365_9BORD|nr:cell division protein ZipA C-terminal FtsZ-binding domain-containing protein [Bordetella holmesii]AHV93281.1 putative membrane protein [Bordetella holmesii ATCC 51541]AIT26891.1 putative membrane protein [Bordetella holmesii 44057]EWM41588.1 putative membrane protein [Bordetella holmesii 41130]EWM47476.1 putative membrane protein [Bordetella holmesii 35009]EWM51640.1 putative membrane protein [Bordetella holmesii 70147]